MDVARVDEERITEDSLYDLAVFTYNIFIKSNNIM